MIDRDNEIHICTTFYSLYFKQNYLTFLKGDDFPFPYHKTDMKTLTIKGDKGRGCKRLRVKIVKTNSHLTIPR